MLILDTDILIDVQRGHHPAIEWLTSLSDEIGIAGFTAMELIQDARNTKEVSLAQKLVQPFTIVWPSLADCDVALELFAKKHGSDGIGLLDSLIACTAMGINAELATFNVRHFRAITELRTVQPYTR